MRDTKRIFTAKQELNQLLRDKPYLQEMQDTLNKQLEKAGNVHNRMVLLQNLMYDKVRELQGWLDQLKEMSHE